MTIRTATESDLPALTEIYNYEVVNGTAPFDIRPKTVVERAEWFYEHNKDNHPLIVAEDGGKILGYASLSPYRDKEAYSPTVELSVYVAPAARGKGAATALMTEILKTAKNDPRTHTVVSVITAGNDISVHLHEKFGFSYCGTLREIGIKFGEYRDTVTYTLTI